jgi:hypothetical protein
MIEDIIIDTPLIMISPRYAEPFHADFFDYADARFCPAPAADAMLPLFAASSMPLIDIILLSPLMLPLRFTIFAIAFSFFLRFSFIFIADIDAALDSFRYFVFIFDIFADYHFLSLMIAEDTPPHATPLASSSMSWSIYFDIFAIVATPSSFRRYLAAMITPLR